MEKTKIVTICGSMRFAKEQQRIAEDLELKNGYCVIQSVYGDGKNYTEHDIVMLDKLHKTKIDVSDSIYVVNIGGYIGNSTKREIEYAILNDKEVLYHERNEE